MKFSDIVQLIESAQQYVVVALRYSTVSNPTPQGKGVEYIKKYYAAPSSIVTVVDLEDALLHMRDKIRDEYFADIDEETRYDREKRVEAITDNVLVREDSWRFPAVEAFEEVVFYVPSSDPYFTYYSKRLREIKGDTAEHAKTDERFAKYVLDFDDDSAYVDHIDTASNREDIENMGGLF